MQTATDTQTSSTPGRVKRYTTGPLPLAQAKTRADRLESLLASHQRNGGTNMTVRELCEAWMACYGTQLFPHHGEAGMAALEAAGRVQCDRENRRHCTVTGTLVKVYWLAEKQAEFF